jgi:ubiquinone/menaquinone biosynthesis C-methylase UbiE
MSDIQKIHKQNKLENPVRLTELNPIDTLNKIGMKANDAICDIGAGSGIFTIPAARITTNKVYALEISDEMLSIIKEKANTEGINNIELVKVNDNNLNMEDGSIDIAIMVTVLHEIDQPTELLKEVKRILKDNGKIAVIEFHKRETPMGPPVEHRMYKEDVIKYLKAIDYIVQKDFDLGDNFNCLVFEKNKII